MKATERAAKLRIAMASIMAIAGALIATAALSVTSGSVAGATVVWSPVTVVPGSVAPGGFQAVSCTGVGNCTAVGYDGNHQPIYATESGGVWGTATEVLAPGGVSFSGVSCTGAGDCTAVGGDSSAKPIYATETAGVWGAPTEVRIDIGVTAGLGSVSCTAVGECTAVGSVGIPGSHGYPVSQPIYATETGGVWRTATQVPGSPSGSGELLGVSCTGAGSCTAVGDDVIEPMYATETAGVWGAPTEAPGFPCCAVFYGVSCTGTGSCTAVGKYGPDTPIYATDTGGVWGMATAVPSSPSGNGNFNGVSCTGAGRCTAVGQGGNGGQPIYSSSMDVPSPTISSFIPTSGPVGTVVIIRGTNLAGATKVTVNGVTATINVDTATKIKITVPIGATTGKIKVFTPLGKSKTATVFTVT